MDDQPKEGAEGDKKIVHTYALVKVSELFFNYLLTRLKYKFNYRMTKKGIAKYFRCMSSLIIRSNFLHIV